MKLTFYIICFIPLLILFACTHVPEKKLSNSQGSIAVGENWVCPDSGIFVFHPNPPDSPRSPDSAKSRWDVIPPYKDDLVPDGHPYQEVYWVGDLNNDGKKDYITSSMGGGRHRTFAAFVACENNKFYQVFYHMYMTDYVNPVADSCQPELGWSDLVAVWGSEGPETDFTTYRWDGMQYTELCSQHIYNTEYLDELREEFPEENMVYHWFENGDTVKLGRAPFQSSSYQCCK